MTGFALGASACATGWTGLAGILRREIFLCATRRPKNGRGKKPGRSVQNDRGAWGAYRKELGRFVRNDGFARARSRSPLDPERPQAQKAGLSYRRLFGTAMMRYDI